MSHHNHEIIKYFVNLNKVVFLCPLKALVGIFRNCSDKSEAENTWEENEVRDVRIPLLSYNSHNLLLCNKSLW